MKLHELPGNPRLKNKSKRKWRWDSSWKWNYSWKWLKWQKARSWHSLKPWFEWWQTRLIQRTPKAKWFKRFFKLIEHYDTINLWKFEADNRISNGMEITKAKLKQLGYIKKENALVKILWDWDYSKWLKFTGMDAFSKWAQEKIDKPWKKTGSGRKYMSFVELKKKGGIQKKRPIIKVKITKPVEVKKVEKKIETKIAKPVEVKKVEEKVKAIKVEQPTLATAKKIAVAKKSTTAKSAKIEKKVEKPIVAKKIAIVKKTTTAKPTVAKKSSTTKKVTKK